MGANQLTKLKHHSSYFDWYFFSFYTASFIGATGIVYVEDNLRWSSGFVICIVANVVALAVFLIGRRFYTRDEPRQSSPFVGLFRVVVASLRKRKAVMSSQSVDYYYGDEGVAAEAPSKRFR